mgnify:CR=1 FL=1
MIKNIILILIFSFVIYSCGKKGDPEYKTSEKKLKEQTILIKKV